MDCSFFGMSSEYFSAHSQWHYAIISLVSTVSLGSKKSCKMMSTFGKTGMTEDSFRGTQTLKSHPLGIQKSSLVYLWSLFFTNKPHHHITVIKHVWSYRAAPITTPLAIPSPPPTPAKKAHLVLFSENLLDTQRWTCTQFSTQDKATMYSLPLHALHHCSMVWYTWHEAAQGNKA